MSIIKVVWTKGGVVALLSIVASLDHRITKLDETIALTPALFILLI
ncbi:MAG: hypothetical protein M3270_07245 [Thermoproteota archaeon]|nr:hypothetical protein [Thermoproteota archaeon]